MAGAKDKLDSPAPPIKENVMERILECDCGWASRFGGVIKRRSESQMRRFMQTLFVLQGQLLALGVVVALSAPGSALAQDKPAKLVESAGVLVFGPNNVLFVGDTKGTAVHAFELRPADITPQTNVALGNAHTFEGRDLIGGIDRKLAALLGTSADQIVINGLVVHRPSKQIFLSVHRGRGPDAIPVIVKVNDDRLEVLDLDRLAHSMIRIADVPGQETLEFGQRERNLAITDITYYRAKFSWPEYRTRNSLRSCAASTIPSPTGFRPRRSKSGIPFTRNSRRVLRSSSRWSASSMACHICSRFMPVRRLCASLSLLCRMAPAFAARQSAS
jgi:hypothetical protein